MPQLAQLRLCCIGPAMARIDDLILPFHDANGQPINSTLWLRNGGGKTFIMQLLLWLMCPDKKKIQTERSIEDYVQPQDRSIIVAEWQLDGSSRHRAPNEPNRYLTGVFCERYAGGEQLQRLFFVARVHPNEPCLTLKGLPIYALGKDRMERRTLASFKHEWQALGNAYPSAEINETETLHTWHRLLEQAGIDSTLFSYQMKMNVREGGAEDLFKFKDADRFVDFFLELMTDTTLGDTTAQTIEKFRTAFQQQTEQLQPEQQLLSHLIEQLEPLRGAADEREQMYHRVQQARQTLHNCVEVVTQNLTHLQEDKQRTELQCDEAINAAQRLHIEAQQKQQRTAILSYAAAQKHEQRLKNELTVLQGLVKTSQLDERIWRAAGPLRDVIRAERDVAMLQERLAAQQKEHEPLLSKVQESARAYAAALIAKREQLHAEENRWSQTKDEVRTQIHAAQAESADKQSIASKVETEANHVDERLASFYKKRTELEAAGVLFPGEEYLQAQDRLILQRAQLCTTIQTIHQNIKRIEQEKKVVQSNISQCEQEKMQAAAEEKLLCRQLDEMQKECNTIEADSRLQQYLQLETIDLDRLDQNALNQLQDAEHTLDNRLTELKLALLEHETIITYLTEHHLLPPTKDVESILKTLRKEHIIAWSGWEFIDKSMRKSNARAILQRMPELAFGVVVRDEHFQKAQDILRETAPHLDTLVVVAPQEATRRDTPLPLFVIGPTSDAHFNRDAGEQELSAQQAYHAQTQKSYVEQYNEKNELHTSIERLRRFFRNYPLHQQNEWRAKRDELATRQATLQTRINQLRVTYQELDEKSEQDRQLHDEKSTALNGVDNHLSQLQAHAEILTIYPDDLKQQRHRLLSEASKLRYESDRLQVKATELEQQAETAATHITRIAVETSNVTRTYAAIQHLNGSPQPYAGDIQQLENLYQQLFAEYEQKIGVNEITIKLEDARNDVRNKRLILSGYIHETISEAMVQEALDTLSDSNEAEDRYHNAIETRINAESNVKLRKDDLTQTSQVILNAKGVCIKLNIPERGWNENIPESEESCRRDAEETEQQAQDAEVEARKREQDAQRLVGRVSQLDKKIHRLESEQSLIQSLLEKHQTLFEESVDCTISIELVIVALDDDGSIQHEFQKLRDVLDGEQKRRQRLEQKRNEVTLAINSLMGEAVIKYPKVTMVQQFLNRYTAEHYERECSQLLDQWTVRKQQVETALASIGEFRQLTISHMLELADSGIELLKRAAKRSKLPPSLPDFQQQPFLKIVLKEALTADERRARINDLLERCMKEGTIPSGLALLQRAVRCLASSIKVEMLFPDPNHLRYVPIAEVAKESGGERLTSFVLLYCSLVQLRATERTKHADASSTLILDNPYGAASRSIFLELQREVAQSMRIQLIYTTGIHDIEAIRMISNVVRLRNDSIDRKTGEQLLQLDAPYQGLQAMRVMLPTAQNTLQQNGYEQ